MAEWLEQVSQRHAVYCHDLEVMSWNLVQVVHNTFVKVVLYPPIIFKVKKDVVPMKENFY